jgi:hypothetical protein
MVLVQRYVLIYTGVKINVLINMFNTGSGILPGLISVHVKVGSQCLPLLYSGTASFSLLGRMHCAVRPSDIMH